ncbi:MAG: hypothetical protein F4Z86_18650 [Gemmatimonadetes bacterium]|nr:hypothetical protein [Gemmatimonadota bacterium]MYB58259.1 hypothetical protein [Gemmatimonadota bacterium]
MDRINLFNPFDSRSRHHEDRLTWAFLVFLRYDSFLQNFLRELIESRLPPELRNYNNTWEPANVSTQTKWIESSTSPFVSVLLTDSQISEPIRVEWSGRNPKYDGIIEYPDRMTLIIENKLAHGDVWREQLSPNRNSLRGDINNNDIRLHDSAVCLEWSEVLEWVVNYADSNLACFCTRGIARDFLSFVENVHPGLTPYHTFKLCGERPEALLRRKNILIYGLAKKLGLESGEDNKGAYLFRPNKIAQRIMIHVESGKLKVVLAPADTVGQARCFYDVVNRNTFLSLQGFHDWRVLPNLHFSYRGSQLVQDETTWEIQRYLDHFSDSSNYGQRNAVRDQLTPLLELWECEGLISLAKRTEIENEFINTGREHINIIPGFTVFQEWDLDTVIELEEREELEECIIAALDAPLKTWGEAL